MQVWGKILLVSTGVASTALVLGQYLSAAVVFAPQFYVAALRFAAPPYLYFLVNVIIIIIIALSSSFYSSREDLPAEPPATAELMKFLTPAEALVAAPAEELVVEKPLVSARFSLRRGPKPTSEGKPLGVAKPRRNETLESTWKAITGGAAEMLGTGAGAGAGEGTWARLREASLGKDDLNHRVEAFLRKAKGDARLRRQESFKRFSQTMSRRTPTIEREGRDSKREEERESSPG